MSDNFEIQADAQSLRGVEASFDEQNPDAAHLYAEVDAHNRKNLTRPGDAKTGQSAVAAEDRMNHAPGDVRFAEDGSMTITLDVYGRRHATETNRASGVPADASIDDLAVDEKNGAALRDLSGLPKGATEAELKVAQDKQWHMETCRAFELPSTATELELDNAIQNWVDGYVRTILQLPATATEQEVEEALSRLRRNDPSR